MAFRPGGQPCTDRDKYLAAVIGAYLFFSSNLGNLADWELTGTFDLSPMIEIKYPEWGQRMGALFHLENVLHVLLALVVLVRDAERFSAFYLLTPVKFVTRMQYGLKMSATDETVNTDTCIKRYTFTDRSNAGRFKLTSFPTIQTLRHSCGCG